MSTKKRQPKNAKQEKPINLHGKVLKPLRTCVNCVKCNNCGDVIYSRARHDCHYCRCGDTMIDGGFDYVRVGWNGVPPKSLKKYVNASKQMLYDDWNWQKNKFGIIGAQGWETEGLKINSKKD